MSARFSAFRILKKRPQTHDLETLQNRSACPRQLAQFSIKKAPPVRIPGRRPSLTATRYSSCARDAVEEVQSQAGLTLQSISYANLKYGLTRRSASFCLRQSTLHDLSPKTSFRRPSSHRRDAPAERPPAVSSADPATGKRKTTKRHSHRRMATPFILSQRFRRLSSMGEAIEPSPSTRNNT